METIESILENLNLLLYNFFFLKVHSIKIEEKKINVEDVYYLLRE